MSTRSTRTRRDDQRKEHIYPERPPQRNCPKQLQSHNLPTDDVGNINSTNKGRNSLLANKPRIVPKGTECMPQKIENHRRATLHRSAYPQREQAQIGKSSYGLDWLQNGITYGSAKLDNKQPQNVQNITWSHKLYRENLENLESGIDRRREKLSWSEDPMSYISSICTITVTIYTCDDVI